MRTSKRIVRSETLNVDRSYSIGSAYHLSYSTIDAVTVSMFRGRWCSNMVAPLDSLPLHKHYSEIASRYVAIRHVSNRVDFSLGIPQDHMYSEFK